MQVRLGALVFVLVAFAGSAGAATLYVGNQGIDSGSCGSSSDPCRSISRAITNAGSGDTIVVGPGRYGDLDEDGTYGETGEEAAEVNTGCDCMVNIDKRLSLRSVNGAAATIIDVNGGNISGVGIEASGVVFGSAKALGFSIVRADENGVEVSSSVNGVTIAGNLSYDNDGDGFAIDGLRHTVSSNRAFRNETGFAINGANSTVSDNVAAENGDDGFDVAGDDHSFLRDVSTANDRGFRLAGGRHQLTSCAALGNRDDGILLLSAATARIEKSNIFGNDAEGSENCGLSNASGNVITATGNYWGSSIGPGPDPADAVCNSGGGSISDLTPISSKEIKLKLKPVL